MVGTPPMRIMDQMERTNITGKRIRKSPLAIRHNGREKEKGTFKKKTMVVLSSFMGTFSHKGEEEEEEEERSAADYAVFSVSIASQTSQRNQTCQAI